MEGREPNRARLAILASGSGSNAEAIMAHFADHPAVEVAWVGSNRQGAGVLERAERHGVPASTFSRRGMQDGELLRELADRQIDWVALAGFLLQVPAEVVASYAGCMVNIHPALLPAYGGPGMYGHHVHEAVKAAGESRSGMTVHWVTEQYDEGAVVFQAEVDLDPADDADQIAQKVLQLEHAYYPSVLEGLIAGWAERSPDGQPKSGT